MAPLVAANPVLLVEKHPNFSSYQTGEGGSGYHYTEGSYAGHVHAKSNHDAFANFRMNVEFTYYGSTWSNVEVFFGMDNAYVYTDPVWGAKAIAKYYVTVLDLTDGSFVQDYDSNFVVGDGGASHYSYFATSLENGHSYQVTVGIRVETGTTWLSYGSAESYGDVNGVFIYGY